MGASAGFAASVVAGFEKKFGTAPDDAGLLVAGGVEAASGFVKPNLSGEPAAGAVAGAPSRVDGSFGASAGFAGRDARGEDTVILGTAGARVP